MARAQKTEVVRLRRVAKSEGATISKDSYDTLSNFIIATLTSNRDHFITLNDLLEKAQEEIEHAVAGDLFWNLLQVKHDLEAREIVTVVVDRARIQRVQLNRKSKIVIS